MTTSRTTNVIQRIDLLYAQAEQFLAANQFGEARARAKQVIAHCDLEDTKNLDIDTRAELEQRVVLAEALLKRIGASVRDRDGQLTVHEEDAAVPTTWD